MTLSLLHTFQSAKSDDDDTTLIRPSNWNAEHTITLAANKIVGAITAGAAVELDCTAAGRALIDDADAAAQRTTLGLTALATTTPGTGIATWLATPSSANLIAAITDKTGSGALVFGTSPTFTTSITVGSTSPLVTLTASTTSAPFGHEFRSGAGTLEGVITLQSNTAEMKLDCGRSVAWGGSIVFVTDTTEKMRITSTGNIGINTSSFGASAAGVVAIANGTAPSSSPGGLGQLYVESGALKYRGSSGTITTLGVA